MPHAYPLKFCGHFQRVCYLLLLCSTSSCAIERGRAIKQEIAPLYSAASPEFRQSTGALLGGGFVPGNSIVTLANGNQIFPAILKAVHGARPIIFRLCPRQGLTSPKDSRALRSKARTIFTLCICSRLPPPERV